jgi:RNA polymerase sigma-70 factor (ECF subfamily)
MSDDNINQHMSTESYPSDEHLLAGLAKGREDMFEQLVQRYQGRLYGFLCRMAGQEADAADLFQETFLRVYQKAGQIRDQQAFRPWLYTIALNLCRSQHARRARHPEVALPDCAEDTSLPATDPSPDSAVAHREIGDRIAVAVNTLPLEQREVFILRAYQDLSYPEIADVLGRPLATVKSQMRYALQKLRSVLRDLASAHGVSDGRSGF